MHSLYIHVPFCQKRCYYCSFYSTTYGKRERDCYVDALLQEMAARCTDEPLSTIYFGGGTPSQLDAEELARIFSAIHRHYNVADVAEVTFECNPDDIVTSDGKATALPALLVQLGVNRVSMGVQTFDDRLLRTINRRHTSLQALQAIEELHGAGIDNISIDLIYGLPQQRLTDWQRAVDQAVSLQHVAHVSSYCLSVEAGTHLYNMRARGDFEETDDDTLLAMYDYMVDAMKKAGFEHYEISNFGKPGYHSRHNSCYWQGLPYTGLGPGAHSYDGGSTRRWNLSDLQAYCRDPLGAYEDEHLSADELYDELIMTRLRTAQGLPLTLLDDSQQHYLMRQAATYLHSGHLRLDTDKQLLALTRKGIFISDTIFSDLMCDV